MNMIKGNLIYMFPGVGSEYHGMGREIYNRYDVVKKIYHTASEVVGIDFYDLCFGNERDKIKENAFAQQALVCICYSLYQVFQEEINLKPDFMMGYSLGEYSALACSKVMNFEDALHVVNQRARIIDEIAGQHKGTMVWVLNIDQRIVEDIVGRLQEQGEEVYISAYEARDKVSVSGTYDSIKVMAEAIEEESGMVIPVKMAGPFHSILMKDAATELRKVLEKITFYPSAVHTIANYTGNYYTEHRENIMDNLSNQLCNPILWHQSLLQTRKGIQNIAVELGPKNVLQYIYKINFSKDICFSIESIQNIQDFKKSIQEAKDKYQEIIKGCMRLVVSMPNHCQSPSLYEKNVLNEYEKLTQFYNELERDRGFKGNILEELNRTYNILQAKGVPGEAIEKRLEFVVADTMIIGG